MGLVELKGVNETMRNDCQKNVFYAQQFLYGKPGTSAGRANAAVAYVRSRAVCSGFIGSHGAVAAIPAAIDPVVIDTGFQHLMERPRHGIPMPPFRTLKSNVIRNFPGTGRRVYSS